MRRCPDCGFRADETICPLCGVRMQENSPPVQMHTHSQSGERCALPKQEWTTEEKQTYHPYSNRKRGGNTPSGFVIAVAVIILVSMLRSCVGML